MDYRASLCKEGHLSMQQERLLGYKIKEVCTRGGPDRKSTVSKGDGTDTYGSEKSKGSLKRP